MYDIAALDFWTLFVQLVFGGFWMAVAGLGLVMFVVMGVLGKMSIYSVTWYCVMFLIAMTLGYGFTLLNILLTVLLLVAFIFSWKSYVDSK